MYTISLSPSDDGPRRRPNLLARNPEAKLLAGRTFAAAGDEAAAWRAARRSSI